jgi:hypothetical protein
MANGPSLGTCSRALLASAALLAAGCGHHDSFTPYALDQTLILPSGDTVQAQLDGQRLNSTATYALETLPTHGTASLDTATGVFNYTPDSGYIGNDAFTWQASDDVGTTNAATVSIQVVAAVSWRAAPVPAGARVARGVAGASLPGGALAVMAGMR